MKKMVKALAAVPVLVGLAAAPALAEDKLSISGEMRVRAWMMDYDEYEETLATGTPKKDEYRSLLTLRLTKLLMNQNLRLSLFGYYSPSDQDTYIRPIINYKASDSLALEMGANIFEGRDDHTFFGQFHYNTNLYGAVRFSF